MKVDLEYLKKWQNTKNKVAIFGAGLFGQYAANILIKCGLVVDCFLDNNPDKWGSTICQDIVCVSPQTLTGNPEYITFICINSEWYDEVEKSAKDNGILKLANFNDVIDDIIVNKTELYMELLHEFGDMSYLEFFYTRNPNNWAGMPDSEMCVETERIAVYTGIFGSYDDIYIPKVCPENIDYYFISDECPVNLEPFRWIDAKEVIPKNITSPIKRNRYIKMHPHLLFPQYKYSIYVDGSIEIVEDISSFVHMNNSGISVFMHPKRECIFYEGITIVNFKRVVAADVCKQMGRYLEEGMPIHYGLSEMGVIARTHMKPECIKIMEDWWQEFEKETQRDQLSFMYVMWKNGMKLSDVTSLGCDVRMSSKVILHKHFRDSSLVENR